MKKQLLASTALVAAGLFGAQQASAQTPFQGPASPAATTQNLPPASTTVSAAQGPRFVIRVSGFITAYVAGVWQDDVGPTTVNSAIATTTGGASTSPNNNASANDVDVFTDWRIRFQPQMNLDNGFSPGGFIEFAYADRAVVVRRAFAYLGSARFGEIRIGNSDAAIGQMEFREPSLHRGTNAGIVDSGLIQNLMLNPTGSPTGATLFSGPDVTLYGRSRRDNVAYYSPRIEGFQLGASFSPELSQNSNSQLPLTNGTQAGIRNVWSIAANFDRTFDPGIVVRLSGGYERGQNPDQYGTGSSSGSLAGVGGGAAASNPSFWYVGGVVGYAGFTVGASYGRGQNWRLTGGQSGTGVPATFTNTIVADGYAWTVGAAYNYGPFGVSVTFMDGRNSDCSTTGLATGACGSRDRNTIVAVNGSYQLGPGVFWEVGVFHAKYSGNEWNNGTFVGTASVNTAVTSSATGVAQSGLQSNTATGVWTGLALQF